MTKLLFVLAAFVALTAPAQQGKLEPRTPATEAVKKVGQTAVVKGKVTQVTKRENLLYLNFEGRFPNHVFSAVIFAKDFATFSQAEKAEGKTVEVDGKIEEYKGKPQIILRQKSQLRVLD
jgi:DNA/RNA endonuclease YhcR with UshA esterase domain